MKQRTLTADRITKVFRKFSGNLALQIDGTTWIELDETQNPQLDQLVTALFQDQLVYVKIDENKVIQDLKIDKYKNASKELLEQVRKVYRHN